MLSAPRTCRLAPPCSWGHRLQGRGAPRESAGQSSVLLPACREAGSQPGAPGRRSFTGVKTLPQPSPALSRGLFSGGPQGGAAHAAWALSPQAGGEAAPGATAQCPPAPAQGRDLTTVTWVPPAPRQTSACQRAPLGPPPLQPHLEAEPASQHSRPKVPPVGPHQAPMVSIFPEHSSLFLENWVWTVSIGVYLGLCG